VEKNGRLYSDLGNMCSLELTLSGHWLSLSSRC